MRRLIFTGLAAAAVASGTPAMAGKGSKATLACATTIDGFAVDGCAIYASNLLNDNDSKSGTLGQDIALLGDGASFTGSFADLPSANTVGGLTNDNGTTGTLSFGGQTLSGDTLIGIHYGNNGDQSTIFYLLDVTSPVTSISGFQSGSFSTATLFSTGEVDAVPEPATWGLMLLGFGGIGMGMRRRRRRNGALMQVA